MELVYLWVEDYKNIHRQGFNFSPRFKCEYNPDTNELTIEENDDYIENFFGENINVTAIVGKNGSGKSSILEFLHSLLFTTIESSYILVFNNGENYYQSNIEEIISDISNEDISQIQCYIYSNDIKEYENSISIKKENVLKNLLSNSLEVGFKLTTFMYIPTIIKIKSIDIDKYFRKVIEYDYTNYSYGNEITYDENRRVMYGQEDTSNQLFEIDNDYHKFLIILFIRKNGNDAFNYNDSLLSQTTLLELMNESEINYLSEEDFNEYIINVDMEKFISELTEEEKSIYLNYYDFFEFDFFDSKNRGYNNLSHGERTIFGQFLSIYYRLIKQYGNNYLFLMDEAELSLHPNWQKNYINELINMLKKVDKKFHFIITSHSPFFLSDIPNQNIIFLDTDENGNCIVVDGLKEKKETFGANIHTLLSDSFFMEDGLMGEFAKRKIQEIIDFLNDKKSINEVSTKKDDIKKVIEAIGEPFLKDKLLQMYYNKFQDEAIKEQRKQELLTQKKRIEEELRRL